jgi:hypothetical protein
MVITVGPPGELLSRSLMIIGRALAGLDVR